jgi:hypothetical protein
MAPICTRHNSQAARILVNLIATLVVFAGAHAARGAEGDLPHEARAVLERFAGEWTTRTRIRQVSPTAREINTQGKATCRATLEGRYFEFRSETVPPGDSELQIMTFDPAAKVYRQWVFASDGYRHEAEGRWDAATTTMRWSGKTADARFVIDDHWVSPDRLQWTLKRTDSQGNLLQTIDGTVERVKPD